MNAVRVTYFESRQIDFLSGCTICRGLMPDVGYSRIQEKDWEGKGGKPIVALFSLIKEARFPNIIEIRRSLSHASSFENLLLTVLSLSNLVSFEIELDGI